MALAGWRTGAGSLLGVSLHAVTIDAPPQRVWSWLVQTGQDRAGFYSYDWLERLFGADIRNVYEVRPAWQSSRRAEGHPSQAPGHGFPRGCAK